MSRTKRTQALAARAYRLKREGTKMAQIAELLDVSERMVFRYIEQHELEVLREKQRVLKEAVKLLDPETLEKFKVAMEKAMANT